MKRVLSVILALCLCISLWGCGDKPSDNGTTQPSDTPEISTAPSEPPSTNNTDTSSAETPTNLSTEDVLSLVDTVLLKSFDDYTINVEDNNVLNVCIFGDGIAEAVSEIAISGGGADEENWVTLKDNFINFADSICNLIKTSGRDDITLSLNLMNDVNRDHILLSLVNTTIFYDVLADTDSSAVNSENNENEPVSREFQNALAKAKTYSEVMHMSKQGIYDQLVSEYGENFPEDAAQYAVDNLEADYNANALAKAKLYYENMNMSKDSIREQLVSEYGEQFTEDEADYAIAHLDD